MKPPRRSLFASLIALLPLLFVSSSTPSDAAEPLPAARTDVDGNPLPEGALARLGTSRWREGAYVWGPCLSPDGKLVAFTTQGGVVRLLNSATGREVRRLVRRGDPAASYPFFSSDGRLLVVLGKEKTIQIWEVATGKLVHTITGRQDFYSLAFSGDGRVLAAGGGFGDKQVRVWEMPSAKEIAVFEVIPNKGADVALSADGKRLATWAADASESWSNHSVGATAQIWEVAKKKEIRQLKADNPVLGLGFAPSGGEVAINTFAGVQIFELANSKTRRFPQEEGKTGYPDSTVSYSPDGKILAIFSPTPIDDDTFILWDAATGVRRSPALGPCPPTSVVFTGNRILACGLHGHTIRVWDVDTGKDLAPLKGHCGMITSLAWISNDRTIVSADAKGGVCTWDAATARMTAATQVCHSRGNYSGAGHCVIAPDGKRAVATQDRQEPFVRILGEKPPREYEIGLPEQPMEVMTSFATAKPVAVLAGDTPEPGRNDWNYRIYLFDLHTRRMTRQLSVLGRAEGVALSEDAKRVAAAYDSDDSPPIAGNTPRHEIAVRIWEAESGKLLRELKTTPFLREWYPWQVPLAFTTDRRILAVGEYGALVGLWDADSGKVLRRLGGEAGWQVDALLIFPDRSTIALGMQNIETAQGKVQLRELASGAVRAEFSGHGGPVSSLALSADGRVLASGSNDTTVILWDLTGLKQRPLERLSAQDGEALWLELGSKDARRAYKAIWRLAAAPREAVAMLAGKLKPETESAPSVSDIARLIRQMDDAHFAVRERASKALRRVGEPARESLKKALAGEPSPETRRRIESLLADLDSGRPQAEEWRSSRAVEALEHAATPEARALLQKLAAGRKNRALTQAAAAALETLSRQHQ